MDQNPKSPKEKKERVKKQRNINSKKKIDEPQIKPNGGDDDDWGISGLGSGPSTPSGSGSSGNAPSPSVDDWRGGNSAGGKNDDW